LKNPYAKLINLKFEVLRKLEDITVFAIYETRPIGIAFKTVYLHFSICEIYLAMDVLIEADSFKNIKHTHHEDR